MIPTENQVSLYNSVEPYFETLVEQGEISREMPIEKVYDACMNVLEKRFTLSNIEYQDFKQLLSDTELLGKKHRNLAELREKKSESLSFEEAFVQLQSSHYWDILLQIQNTDYLQVKKLHENMSKLMSDLRKSHSQEPNRDSNLQKEEVQLMESTLLNDIQLLKNKQKKKFREYVMDPTKIPKPKQDSRVDEIVGMGFSQEQAKAALTLESGNLERALNLILEAPDKVEKYLSKSASHSRSNSQVDLRQRSQTDSPLQLRLSRIAAGHSGRKVAEKRELSETFTVYCGAHIKTMYNIRLVSSPLDELFASQYPFSPTFNAALKAQNDSLIYSDNLNGLVLTSCENLKPWIDWCNASTDYHFQDEFKKDLLISRHSNLPNIQVLFHLDSESNELADSLKKVIKIAHKCSIQHLTIPVLLSKESNSNGSSTLETIKRAEFTFKTTRAALNEWNHGNTHFGFSHTSDQHSRYLQFVLDPSREQDFEAVRDRLVQVFRTT